MDDSQDFKVNIKPLSVVNCFQFFKFMDDSQVSPVHIEKGAEL